MNTNPVAYQQAIRTLAMLIQKNATISGAQNGVTTLSCVNLIIPQESQESSAKINAAG